MSTPRAGGSDGDGHSGNRGDALFPKVAGVIVFSGIALSILKTLNPFGKDRGGDRDSKLIESTRPIQDVHSAPPLQQKTKNSTMNPSTYKAHDVQESSSSRTIEIEKGDTLWGLSKKHEVSIEAIKEANGLEGDRIYAGKKLVLPSMNI